MTIPTFDADGYPSEDTIRVIQDWHLDHDWNPDGLLKFCADAWNTHYGRAQIDYDQTANVITYTFITGGWSGNEEVISALMGSPFQCMMWVSSNRGGKHVFEEKL